MPHLLSWDKDESYYSYHAGSYLQNMMAILVLMQGFLMMPMLYLVIAKWKETGILYLLTLFVMSVLIGLRYIRIERRRNLLENEILSIHSCGVIWQAVALVHLLARKDCGVFCEHYTELLIGQCHTIQSRLFDIHRWFNEKMGLQPGCAPPQPPPPPPAPQGPPSKPPPDSSIAGVITKSGG